MNRAIVHITFVSILSLVLFLIGSCRKDVDFSKSKTKTVLKFQQTWLHQPQEKYFEITVDLEEKIFSKPGTLEDLPKFEESKYQAGAIKDLVLKATAPEGEVVKILDISPDKHWASAILINKYGETGKKEPKLFYDTYLINLGAAKMVTKFAVPMTLCYFANDSKSYFFRDSRDVKRVYLHSGEVDQVGTATTFFVVPSRDKLVLFDKFKISLSNLDGDEKEVCGEYKHHVYASGLINKKWAYFLTSKSNKGGPKKLYFINLLSYDIVRYPYNLPEVRLIRVITEHFHNE